MVGQKRKFLGREGFASPSLGQSCLARVGSSQNLLDILSPIAS
ncbi:putative lipoprotein [Leptospira santarosai str. CBC1531]|nr:putative lipoprotein [Leptospira santarosai str. CBC1531]